MRNCDFKSATTTQGSLDNPTTQKQDAKAKSNDWKTMTFQKKNTQSMVKAQNHSPRPGMSKQSNSIVKFKAYDTGSGKFIEPQSFPSPSLIPATKQIENIHNKGKIKGNEKPSFLGQDTRAYLEIGPVTRLVPTELKLGHFLHRPKSSPGPIRRKLMCMPLLT